MSIGTDSPALTSPLEQLITSIRSVAHHRLTAAETADAVAAQLSSYLTERHPLPEQYRRADTEHYLQHVIHAESDGSFSLVALVWLPGQATPIHDHLAWCVTGVAEGEEHEQRYELRHDDRSGAYLAPTNQATNPLGAVSALAPPGDIHQVHNSSDSLTVSLHVYGADIAALGSSIRRSYDNPVARD